MERRRLVIEMRDFKIKKTFSDWFLMRISFTKSHYDTENLFDFQILLGRSNAKQYEFFVATGKYVATGKKFRTVHLVDCDKEDAKWQALLQGVED